MEINPAYRKFIKVIKAHGVTEWGVPPQGNPESLVVDEFIACREINWSDTRGVSGSLRLTATPVEYGPGLVELTMRALRIPGSPSGFSVNFQITDKGISARTQKYSELYKEWVDSVGAAPQVGSKYVEQLIRTAGILEEKFSKNET
jgi:hypothetical protein